VGCQECLRCHGVSGPLRSPHVGQVALYDAGRLIRTVEVARQDLATMEGGVSASSAWQLLWWVGAIFCVLAGAWFLALAVPDEDSPLAWVLALAFGLVCIAAAASLRRLLREAFVSPGPVSYSSALLVTSLWAFISAGLMSACARVGAGKAARGWAVSFVAFSGVSAYCFWRVL
jgi:hypothetical protein